MQRRLRLVVRTDSPEVAPAPRFARLSLVPDTADGIIRTVELYACLLQHDTPALSQASFRSKGHADPVELCASIYCLPTGAASRLARELRLIAEMSINRDVRVAALMKLVELELSK